jgi:ribosomal protein L11 methyltransferase
VPNFDVLTNSVSDSSWNLIDVTVSADDAEIVSDFLWSHGVVAIEEIAREGDMLCLRSSVGEQPQEFLTLLQGAYPHVASAIVQVDKSVSETWRQFAQPTWVNDDFVIVPQWLSVPEASRVLIIEPLDTFGLGNHPTTVLALRLSMQHIHKQSEVFDLGSGSGILAIAAAKFLHCTALAFDIAHGAQQALRLNAELNDVAQVSWSEGYPQHSVDAVLANILAPVLIEHAIRILATVRNGGVVILSGMRLDQVDNVVKHFPNCEQLETMELDGWVAVVLRKNES